MTFLSTILPSINDSKDTGSDRDCVYELAKKDLKCENTTSILCTDIIEYSHFLPMDPPSGYGAAAEPDCVEPDLLLDEEWS